MSRDEEWNEFLENLFSCTLRASESPKEREERQQRLDRLLATGLTREQKCQVEELLFDVALAAEQRSERIYRQGLRVGVWLLRNLESLV